MFDLITSASSIHGAYWMEGAGGIYCENRAMDWLVSLTGMPSGAFGVFTSGGTAANLSANPLDSMTTVTVQIVAMLTGEGSFDHPATLSAFALGFILFLVTLALNFIALSVVKRYREAYE